MSYLNGFVSFIQSFPQHNPIADDWQAAKELLRHLKRAGNETYRLTLFRSASNIDAFVDGLVLLSKIAPQGSKVSPLTETLSLLCSLCRIARHRTRLAADLDFVTALAYRIVSTDDSLWMDQFLILMKSVSADSLSCFVYPPPQITSLLSALVTTM